MIVLNYFKNFQQDIYYQEFQNLTPSLKMIRIIVWKKWHIKDQTISQLSSQWVRDYIILQKVKPSIIRVSIKIDINIQKIVSHQCVILYPYVWNVFKFYACNFLTFTNTLFQKDQFPFPFLSCTVKGNIISCTVKEELLFPFLSCTVDVQ